MNRFTAEDLTAEGIKKLVDEGVEESQELEYKTSMNDDTLTPIAAMANKSGGLLLFGIQEAKPGKNNTGRPERIVGIGQPSADTFVLTLENRIHHGIEPRIRGLIIRAIEVDGLYVVAVLIPRSIAAPHQITGKGTFYTRGERSNQLMSVDEIRWSFMWSHGLAEAVRRFRDERISIIVENDVPVTLDISKPSRLVLHLIPFGAINHGGDILRFDDMQSLLRIGLLDSGFGSFSRHNLDGFLVLNRASRESPSSYTQVFRNGIIEGVCAGVEFAPPDDLPTKVNGKHVEQNTLDFAARALRYMKMNDVQPPVSVFVSLLGLKGSVLSRNPLDPIEGLEPEPKVFDRTKMPLQEVVFEDLDGPLPDTMKPVFDEMWRAAGHGGSPDFDKNGNYTGRYTDPR